MARNRILDIIIGLKDSTAKGVKKVAKNLESLAKKTRSVGKKMEAAFTGLLKPIGLVGAALAGISTVMVGWSLKAAASFEMLNTQLESVMATKEEANKAFEESMEFSVSTPFQAEDIVQTRVALEGVGIKGKEAVEAVANGAAALNKNILDVASAVKSLETEPLRNLGIQLQKAGNNFTFNYKSKMGIDVEVNADSFEEAQQKVLTIFEDKFGGSVDRAAATFEGKMSTLKDAWKQFSGSFGAGFLDEAKDIVQDIIDLLNNNRPAAEKFGEALGDKLREAYDYVKKIKEQIDQSGKSTEEVFSAAMRASAKVLLNAIAAGLKASLEIWKLVGKTIFAAFKEELLKIDIPGLGGFGGENRKAWAGYNASQMDDETAADMLVKNNIISPELAANPDFAGSWSGRLESAATSGELSRDTEASLGATLSPTEVTKALTDFTTAVKDITTGLTDDVKSAISESFGTPEETTADSGQLIRVKIPDGEFIGDEKGVEEFIEELRTTDEALANMVQKAVNLQTSSTKAAEAAKTSADAASKASEESVKASEKINTAMSRAADASIQSAQLTQRTILAQEQSIALLSNLSVRINDIEFLLDQTRQQVSNMRS